MSLSSQSLLTNSAVYKERKFPPTEFTKFNKVLYWKILIYNLDTLVPDCVNPGRGFAVSGIIHLSKRLAL